MSSTSEAASAADTPNDATPRRRGLGPFSGTQLTIIIVTFAVLLLFPIGAWAVTGSNVFVTDAVSGKQASVNASNQLQTAENAPTVLAASGTLSVNPASTGVLFLGKDVSAYKDIRLIITQNGVQPNHEIVELITRAGTVQATLDSWTMGAASETRMYQTPGQTLTALVFNVDTVGTASYSWSLIGRAN